MEVVSAFLMKQDESREVPRNVVHRRNAGTKKMISEPMNADCC